MWWQIEGGSFHKVAIGMFPRGGEDEKPPLTVMIEKGQTETEGSVIYNRREEKEAASITGTNAHSRQQQRINMAR